MENNVKTLKEQCYFLRKSNVERKDYISNQFKPQFIRYIGVFDDYANIIKTLNTIAKNDPLNWLFFENSIDFKVDFEVIWAVDKLVRDTLKTYNKEFKNSGLVVFENDDLNKLYLESLDYVIGLANENEKMEEHFKNLNIKVNFIVSLIMQSVAYLPKLNFNTISNNKCIYYGDLSENDSYFLIMLYRLMFDVIYINPETNYDVLAKTDTDNLSIKVDGGTSKKLFLKDLLANGREIKEIVSTATLVEENVHRALYNNGSIFKNWQFADGNTNSIFFNGTISDIYGTYRAEAKLREGFEVNGQVVSIPHFFMEIEGVNEDIEKYKKLFQTIVEDENCSLYINSLIQKVIRNGRETINSGEPTIKTLPAYSNFFSKVALLKTQSGIFDIDKLERLDFSPLRNVRDNTLLFILNKINETLKSDNFRDKLTVNEEVDFVLNILFMNPKIIKQIENFDFTRQIPKIALFMESENYMDSMSAQILLFLNEIGFDIFIFAPDTKSGLSNYVKRGSYTNIRLDEFKKITPEELAMVDDINKSKDKSGINIFSFFSFGK